MTHAAHHRAGAIFRSAVCVQVIPPLLALVAVLGTVWGGCGSKIKWLPCSCDLTAIRIENNSSYEIRSVYFHSACGAIGDAICGEGMSDFTPPLLPGQAVDIQIPLFTESPSFRLEFGPFYDPVGFPPGVYCAVCVESPLLILPPDGPPWVVVVGDGSTTDDNTVLYEIGECQGDWGS